METIHHRKYSDKTHDSQNKTKSRNAGDNGYKSFFSIRFYKSPSNLKFNTHEVNILS